MLTTFSHNGFSASLPPTIIASVLAGLEVSAEDFGPQHDTSLHAKQAQMLAAVFASKTQTEWVAVFDNTDACVTPVLSYKEAASHPHMQSRGALTEVDGMMHPAKVPVFVGDSSAMDTNIASDGDSTREILRNAGVSAERIAELEAAGAVRQS